MIKAIVKIYGNHVIKGTKLFEDVPETIQNEVKEYILSIDSTFFAGNDQETEDIENPTVDESSDTSTEDEASNEEVINNEDNSNITQEDNTNESSESSEENTASDDSTENTDNVVDDVTDADTISDTSEDVKETGEDNVNESNNPEDTGSANVVNDLVTDDVTSEDLANEVEPFSFSKAYSDAMPGDVITLEDDVTLSRAFTLSKAVTIDLNGHNITSEKSCLSIDADVGIKGTGNVTAGSGGSYTAITVKSGNVGIYGGTYSVGADENNEGNSCIYVNGDAVHLTICGGTFSTEAAYKDKYYVINKKNSCQGVIVIQGGTFINYDPSTGDDSETGDTFVDSGYIAVTDDNCNSFKVVKEDATTIS